MKQKLQQLADLASRNYAKAGALVGTAFVGLPAFAQAVDPFTEATTEITGKITTYGSALVGVAAVGVVFMVAMKYVKKLPRAS